MINIKPTRGSTSRVCLQFKKKKFFPYSLVKNKYCGEPPWPRGSVLGFRPPGLVFQSLCLESSVISPSSGGSPAPVQPICAQRWPKTPFISFTKQWVGPIIGLVIYFIHPLSTCSKWITIPAGQTSSQHRRCIIEHLNILWPQTSSWLADHAVRPDCHNSQRHTGRNV